MFSRGSCIRVSGIPFAAESTQKGSWVSCYNHQTGEFKLVPSHEYRHGPKELHYVIQDSIEPTQSMVDMKYYDSKSALREHYSREGRVEVGNDLNGVRDVCQKPRESMRETLRIASEMCQSSSHREMMQHVRERWREGREVDLVPVINAKRR